ncbi:MAG TPA: hypothetical protein VGA75_14225 [Paracoccaceae bacterium]
MGKYLIRQAAVLAVLGQPVLPALAQEGGLRFHFDIEERLSHGRNLALEVPAEGTTQRAETRLSFGLISETRSETLVLEMGIVPLLAREPGEKTGARLDEPSLRFSYDRESANAALALGADYREIQVDDLPDLSEFVDDEGNPDLPDDLADLVGSGTRADYRLQARLDLGTAAPLGLTLEAGLSGRDYTDTTDPDLFDSRRETLAATTRLRFSPLTEGSLGLSHARYDAEDAEDTLRETTALDLGVTHALSARAGLSAGIGYTVIDTRELGVTTREDGLTGRLGLDYEMPNGTADARLDSTTDQNGARLTLSFGRALDLPAGALSARLGVTRAEGSDPALIGALDWRHDLPTGQISARAERREKSTADDDAITRTTLLILGYDQELTAVSGLNLGLSYAQIDETGANMLERADLTASYRHALTADWDMNFGLAWRMRDEATEGRATSEEVFFSLNRRFEWQR